MTMLKKGIILLLFAILFSADAYMTGAFDWQGHETADTILIVKIKSYEINIKASAKKQEATAKFYIDVLDTLKGGKKSAIEISCNSLMGGVGGPRFCNEGHLPAPEKYYLAFLKYEDNKLTPLDIDLPFVLLPEYFPPPSKMTPKEALLFELESCLKSKNIETVRASLKSFDKLSLPFLPSPESLRPLTKSSDIEIKSIAINFLLRLEDKETIECIEKILCSGHDIIGITGKMLIYPSVLGKPVLFSTQACNALASSKNFELKRAGVNMLRHNADISSIPVLLKCLDCENDEIQYSAYYVLMGLTGHIQIQGFSTFKEQKADIIKYWRIWGEKEADTFMNDPKNARLTTKRDPLETSY